MNNSAIVLSLKGRVGDEELPRFLLECILCFINMFTKCAGAEETLEMQTDNSRSTPPTIHKVIPSPNLAAYRCAFIKHCCVDTLFHVWFDFDRLLWTNSINHKCWENTLKLLHRNTPWKWIEKNISRNAIYARRLSYMTSSAIQRIKNLGGKTTTSDHKVKTSFMNSFWEESREGSYSLLMGGLHKKSQTWWIDFKGLMS